MKMCIKNLSLLLMLTSGLGLMPAGRATAQTFTVLHSFTNSPDGRDPESSVVLSSNTLYGTTCNGGSSGNGTVFAVKTDGSHFTNLYAFSALVHGTNSDGADPFAGLILQSNTLYGTTTEGGTGGNGTVFAVNINGTGFTNLHNFTAANPGIPNSDGAEPFGDLILSGNKLYGTANSGGSYGYGTVFAINTDGTDFTNLHSFNRTSDGAYLWAGLILSGNTLYGTANSGGSYAYGTVFAVCTNGTGFTNLHSFASSDGQNPRCDLILSGGVLYGTTESYNNSAVYGTVFAINTNGTGFTNLCSSIGAGGPGSRAGLIISGNTLYGTTFNSGSVGGGTVFAINTDGTGLTNLINFGYNDIRGAQPDAELILSSNILYGTATSGGNYDIGTVFSLSLPPPQLTINRSGANIILTWPTYAPEVTLQSTTNLTSPAAWTTVSPQPVVANAQNTVTNPISGQQQFYRLSQ